MKQNRADSVTEAVNASQASSRPIEPPSNVPLDERDMGFFANVLEEFARDEWTPHQLQLAAMLTRTMADLEQEQRTLRAEGYVIETDSGKSYENPRVRSVRGLTGDLLAQRRSLSLHARARTGETRDVAKRRSLKKANEIDDGYELLAKPN